jgi:hypothetical protein
LSGPQPTNARTPCSASSAGKFYFNQCYNPFAHEYDELHSNVLPYGWAEVMVRSSFAADYHETRWVCATLHRHYAYAFGPYSIFHHRRLLAVFWATERVPVLIVPIVPGEREEREHPRCLIKKAQSCVFRCMQHQTRTRWLAAVRIILLKCGLGLADVIDKMILAPLYTWHLAQCDLCAAEMPDRLGDNSFYLMEEAIERALHGASISFA